MYVKLVTEIPNPKDVQFYNSFSKYEARSMHGQLPVVWEKAKDFSVYDKWGNVFLDFTSGIGVTNTGHANPHIQTALKYIIDKPLLYSYTFPTEVRYAFLKQLIDTCYPGGKAFLVSSGTEAVECACKLMKLYGKKQNEERKYIVSFKGSMHGRTLLAENLRGDYEWADKIPSILTLDFPKESNDFLKDFYALNIKPSQVCGIMLEVYQGWSGTFYPYKYIIELEKFARRHNILICFDEIQGGFGRTGKLFTFEHYGLQKLPDLICVGKGISGSLPLSGVIGREDILDIPEVASMSSTHSANPLSCASGLGNLKRMRKIVLDAEVKGQTALAFLTQINRDIRGWGLMYAVVTNTTAEADKIVWECFKKGLLTVWTHRNSVKIMPPLIIPEDALMEGLEILKEVLK